MSLVRDLAEAARHADSVSEVYLCALKVVCAAGRWPVGRARGVRDPGAGEHGADGSRSRDPEFDHIWHLEDPERGALIRREIGCAPDGDGAGPADHVLETVLETGTARWIEDVTRDPDSKPPDRSAEVSVRGALVVPLSGRGAGRPVLEFYDLRPRSPDRRMLKEVEVLGAELAWSGELKEREQRSRLLLDRLVEAVQAIAAGGVDPDRVMRVAAERAQALTRAPGAAVHLLSEDDPDVLVLREGTGEAERYKGLRIPLSTTLSGHAFRSGRVFVSNDCVHDSRVNQEAIRDTGARALVAVPLEGEGGRPAGHLNVFSDRPHAFEDEDVQLLRLLSEHMGGALEKARAFRANERLMESLSRTAGALEEALEEREAILDASLHPILAMNSELELTVWSRAAEELYGWTEEEVVGRPLPFLLDFRRQEALLNIGRVLGGETLHQVDATHLRKDGSTVDVRLSAAPIRSADGEPGVVAVITDMTERRRVELRLRQAERMESIGRLAGGVAHDFNNMLTAIRGHADLLLAEGLSPEAEDSAKEIARVVERAASVTDQLLTYSRRRPAEARPVDPAGTIRELSDLLDRLVGERIRISLELDPGTGPVRVDPAQLDQVVMNLVLNARDSMSDGGQIRISCAAVGRAEVEPSIEEDDLEDGPYVRISVSDEGKGVPPEIRSRLLEPFFSTKDLTEGSGLGLATVHAIARQSGGAVRLETRVGKGSTFHVYLPEADADAPEDPPTGEGEARGR